MSLVVRAGDPVEDTTTDRRWTPFRVVATLADPLISIADPMHLDGPLSWCAYLAAREARVVLPPLTRDRCVDLRLPLATWTSAPPPGVDPGLLGPGGDVWGWACSRAEFVEHGAAAVQIRKKPPLLEFARYTTDRRHHDALGAHKARNDTRPARLVTKVVWWALGDPDATGRLLTRLRALGGVTGHGNGRIRDVTVEASGPGDWDRWRDRDFPDPWGHPGAVRAPYWHPTRRSPVSGGV